MFAIDTVTMETALFPPSDDQDDDGGGDLTVLMISKTV